MSNDKLPSHVYRVEHPHSIDLSDTMVLGYTFSREDLLEFYTTAHTCRQCNAKFRINEQIGTYKCRFHPEPCKGIKMDHTNYHPCCGRDRKSPGCRACDHYPLSIDPPFMYRLPYFLWQDGVFDPDEEGVTHLKTNLKGGEIFYMPNTTKIDTFHSYNLFPMTGEVLIRYESPYDIKYH
jgi:hypothetical protein